MRRYDADWPLMTSHHSAAPFTPSSRGQNVFMFSSLDATPSPIPHEANHHTL